MFKPRGKKSKAWVRIALRTLKWGTLAAALLVAGVWAGGRVTKFHWRPTQESGDPQLVYVDVFGAGGCLIVLWESRWIADERLSFDHAAFRASGGRSPFLSPIESWPQMWAPSARWSGTWFGRVVIPYWLPILLFASISGGLFWRDRRASRRAKAGDCPSCGYSRAGLPLGAKCPECGNPKV